jgi:hypothetical protein
MKRAKIVLTAVAVFAVVGGALAFKATRIGLPMYRTNAQGLCIVPTTLSYTTVAQFPGQPFTTYTSIGTTSVANGACLTTSLYTIN